MTRDCGPRSWSEPPQPIRCASRTTDRPAELQRLYELLATLNGVAGHHYLRNYDTDAYPDRGIYFVFSAGTNLDQPPETWELTRIGTIGVSEGSTATLSQRLRQHRGTASSKYGQNGGNHRGSVFRRWVGEAFINRMEAIETYPYWGETTADLPDVQRVRREEHQLEQQVSAYIRNLPLLVVNVPGEATKTSDRAYIEKNLIGLVSQQRRQADISITGWLGNDARHEIRRSGLWNVAHINGLYDTGALDRLEACITENHSSPENNN